MGDCSSTGVTAKRIPGTILRLVAAIATLVLASQPALAQVNVESLRKAVVVNGVGARLNGSLATYRGNTDGTELGASGLIGGSFGRHLAYLNASGKYSKYGSKLAVARSFAHARYNFAWFPWLSVEALGQVERDRLPRIALRTLLGAGLRASLIETESFSSYLGATHLVEHNRLLQQFEPVRPATVQRLGSYLTGVAQFPSGGTSLSSTLYLQPRIGKFSDVRLLWESSLSFDFAPHFTAGIHAKLRYETPVIDGVKSSDLAVTNTIGLKL